MGLDQHLYIKKFIWNNTSTDSKELEKTYPAFQKAGLKPRYISFELMYWRKANAIHKWFVDNVQEGEDDCGTYEVPEEKLKELLAVLKQVMKYHDTGEVGAIAREVVDGIEAKAPRELLPPMEGFFFGNTDCDEWYCRKVADTVERLDWWFSLPDEERRLWDAEYHSSW